MERWQLRMEGVLSGAIRNLDTPWIDAFMVGNTGAAAENRLEFFLGRSWFDEFRG